MKTLLYITPHLSTGGLPQYLLKKIETFNSEFNIWCIEWNNLSDHFVVQKNKIKSILQNKLITLGEEKMKSIDIISGINPDIIHIEEIPETFIEGNILDILYNKKRKYHICVTTHSSQTNPINIKYTADKFVLVSEWSQEVFNNHYKGEIPCDVWEYPIETLEFDKTESKKKIGFDLEYKHVLNIGLFTPGKNQAELIELARKMEHYKIKFHFVGNQAVNFQDYWKPLMNNLPHNCIIHGEKNNVEDYFSASDVFYFTSNFELNPLVVKEALSFGLPTFIKKLETYKNTYDNRVIYIDSDSNQNVDNLLSTLKIKKSNKVKSTVKEFYWGDKSQKFISHLTKEIFEDRIYERFFSVNPGDVVLDLGASIGPFVYSILDNKPSICYVVEPLTKQIEIIQKNLNYDNVKIIRGAITDKKRIDIEWDGTIESPPTYTFDELVSKYSINKIDFLKCDCEGGEYDVFQPKNLDLLLKIPKIVGEFHLGQNRDCFTSKFIWFRDNILKYFTKVEVYSVDGVNIKWDLYNEHFTNYYKQVIIYIDNR